jgi:uncharacterized membrane protein YeaQ/YmgE (transglycosylase-associated protein family)
MSYLFIVVIGAIVGFVAGQYIKGSEHGSGIDMLAGAVGGSVAVALSRVASPLEAAGYVMSIILTVIGGVAALYGMRMLMRSKPAPVKIKSRRY